MNPKRERLLNRMGSFYVLSAVVGFLAWAVYCRACSRIYGSDYCDGYYAGMEDGLATAGGDEID